MPRFETETQSFRHRGFQPADPTQPRIMMFGSDPAPVNPDGTPMHKLWDNDVSQNITVSEHVETVAIPVVDPSGAV